jgi:hypothetical protein
MKPKTIGQWWLGTDYVTLIGRDGIGGEFERRADKLTLGVGLTKERWLDVAGVLTHEAVELAMAQMNARYKPSVDLANGSDGYVFHCDHADFSEVCARAGEYIALALPSLTTEWKRRNKKR